MRFKLLFGAALLVVLSFYLINPSKTYADEQFSTSYDVNYDVGLDGVTQVTEDVTLKNLTDRFYASSFTLTIGSTQVTDVSAQNSEGSLDTTVGDQNQKSVITIKFNQQIAGLGKEQQFTLRFKSKDFAQSLGKNWEINLPKVPQTGNVQQYNLSLSVPLEFGDWSSISPRPLSQSRSLDKLTLEFDQDQLKTSGVSVDFGNSQVYQFDLKYHLQGNSLLPSYQKVALPPDTDYQAVIIQTINPKPDNVTIDADGNYLAWYRLSREQKLEVEVDGLAKLNIVPSGNTTLNQNNQQVWTSSQKYWEKDNPQIISALNEIFKSGIPATNKQKESLIYRYVVDTLHYDSDRANSNNVERLGAVTALNNPNLAVCMEFTDLFIALSRAAGVPARELDGYAYSQNKTLLPLSLDGNSLHAWPQYYDGEGNWIMVDPTWENTSGGVDYFNKIDLNHLVFAIKGVSSDEPFITNDVKVGVSDEEFKPSPQIKVSLLSANLIWPVIKSSLTVEVTNTGNSLQSSLPIALSGKPFSIFEVNSSNSGQIPPFGHTNTTFAIKAPIWNNVNETVNVIVGEKQFTKNLAIKPLLFFISSPYSLLVLVGLIFAVYLAVFGAHIAKHHKKLISKKN